MAIFVDVLSNDLSRHGLTKGALDDLLEFLKTGRIQRKDVQCLSQEVLKLHDVDLATLVKEVANPSSIILTDAAFFDEHS